MRDAALGGHVDEILFELCRLADVAAAATGFFYVPVARRFACSIRLSLPIAVLRYGQVAAWMFVKLFARPTPALVE